MPHDESLHPPAQDDRTPNQIESPIEAAARLIEVDAVELKTIEVRLNGVREAAHRSRFVFLVMTIVAAAILITLWNSVFSWNESLASSEKGKVIKQGKEQCADQQLKDPQKIAECYAREQARRAQNLDELVGEWVKNRTISVGLLGIRVDTSDLTVIGSVGMIVIMTWYFFSQRRENRAIVTLLQDCTLGFGERRLSRDACSLVYHGIVHSLVFIDSRKGDEPLSNLDPNRKGGRVASSPSWWVLGLLTYLPPLTILLIMMTDAVTLWYDSPFRQDREKLSKVIFDPFGREGWKVVGFEMIAVAAVCITWRLCRSSRRFSAATSKALSKFEEVIEKREYIRFLENPEVFLDELDRKYCNCKSPPTLWRRLRLKLLPPTTGQKCPACDDEVRPAVAG